MRPRVRFAFEIVDGPNAGLRSGGWRVWTAHDTTYITSAELGNTTKVSLHGDDYWALGQTKEHYGTGREPVWNGEDRAVWRFTPPAFESGYRLAFVVAASRGSMRREQTDPREMVVPVPDRWDKLPGVLLWQTEPGVVFESDSVLTDPLPLANGRQLWLTTKVETIPASRPEPPPAGSVVLVKQPEDGFRAPTLLVRGLNVG